METTVKRKFYPEVESVWNKDYQCNEFRGVVIDDDSNIVERCSKLYREESDAFKDAEKKIACSPLYSKSTSEEMKAKLAEYKANKAKEDMQTSFVILDPKEWNGWQYCYDRGLYRFRYTNQEQTTSVFIARKSKSIIGQAASFALSRKGEDDRNFYMERVEEIYDIEKLPGHKDIWQIHSVVKKKRARNGDYLVWLKFSKYNNILCDYGKHESVKKVKIKRKWPFYNTLVDYIEMLIRR